MTNQHPEDVPQVAGQDPNMSSAPPPPPPPPPWTEGQGGGWQQAPPPPGGGWAPPPQPPSAGYGYGPAKPTDAFGRPLADWWRRAVAIIIDGVIIAIPLYILFFVVVGVSVARNCQTVGSQTFCTNTGGLSASIVIMWIIGIVAPLVYFALLDGSEKGQTPGKMALHIATRDAATGGSIGHGRAFVRRFIYEILWWLFFIPGLLNVLSPLWDARRQAWHDKAVNSVVIDVP
jgi:uncharacterized RDD family membrane protein YckC